MGLFDNLFSAPPVVRSEAEQARVDELTRNMILYQTPSCPYCLRVLRQIKRMALNIELRDVYRQSEYRRELMQGGGDTMIPCLRYLDQNGEEVWLYESLDIIAFLAERFDVEGN